MILEDYAKDTPPKVRSAVYYSAQQHHKYKYVHVYQDFL